MIKSDFHVHTSFSTDSDTPAREQIEALINKGITEICITDHHDIGYTAMEKADVNTSESTNTNIESLIITTVLRILLRFVHGILLLDLLM